MNGGGQVFQQGRHAPCGGDAGFRIFRIGLGGDFHHGFGLFVFYGDAVGVAGAVRVAYDAHLGGIGAITLPLSEQAEAVVANEYAQASVDYARKTAEDNGVNNVRYIAGPAEKIMPRIAEEEKVDVLVVDPPRAGLDPAVIESAIQASPETMIYVSCNPSTLARDLALLKEQFHIQSLTPIDMFPHTAAVETVALLSKLDVDKHIDVEIKLDELDLTSAESKATYAQIKEYILEKFNLKVSTLYIAQIKRKCGIELREHYNKSKKEKQVIPQCTPEKEETIMDALRHFKMI